MNGYQCLKCGAFLDPGEKCDCQNEADLKEEENKKREYIASQIEVESNGQLRLAV